MACLIVEREIYESRDRKSYYGYFVRGKVRGREVKVDLMPKNKDFDGYEILDIIFDIAPTAQLVLRDEEMTSESGKSSTYTVYEVQNTDEDGILYSYKVKPRAESDKSILNILLQQAARAEAKVNEAKADEVKKK